MRLLRGTTATGETSPGAKIVAVLVILGMLAVAAPAVFVVASWVLSAL